MTGGTDRMSLTPQKRGRDGPCDITNAKRETNQAKPVERSGWAAPVTVFLFAACGQQPAMSS
jgi:hypothetical protein